MRMQPPSTTLCLAFAARKRVTFLRCAAKVKVWRVYPGRRRRVWKRFTHKEEKVKFTKAQKKSAAKDILDSMGWISDCMNQAAINKARKIRDRAARKALREWINAY